MLGLGIFTAGLAGEMVGVGFGVAVALTAGTGLTAIFGATRTSFFGSTIVRVGTFAGAFTGALTGAFAVVLGAGLAFTTTFDFAAGFAFATGFAFGAGFAFAAGFFAGVTFLEALFGLLFAMLVSSLPDITFLISSLNKLLPTAVCCDGNSSHRIRNIKPFQIQPRNDLYRGKSSP